jgi:hypothetical protein
MVKNSEPLYNADYYSDDPDGFNEQPQKKKIPAILGALLLLVGGGFFVQTTLAANIDLGSGPVEFGQGITQAVACDSDGITLRPESSFVNSEGGGSFKVGSIVFSDIDSGCSGKSFTIKAFENTSSTPINLVGSVSSIVVTVSSSSPWFTIPTTAGVTLTNTSSTGFTITLDPTATPAATADVFKFTIESSEASTYAVGNRGPGGGIVFYAVATSFASPGSTCDTSGPGGISTCKYLEVAPATWQGAGVASDSTYRWSDTSGLTGQNRTDGGSEGYPYVDVRFPERFNWKIGQGFYNTSIMKVTGATSAAQAAVLAYSGSVTAGQWFIPSLNELNELCKYANGQTTGNPKVACGVGTLKTGTANDLGGFVGDKYWSSSEHDGIFTHIQDLNNGGRNFFSKSENRYVRPIRAF